MEKLLPRWMRESVAFYSPVPTVCTCNSHRLRSEWREPGHSALSALMMRQLEAIFQLGPVLTLKHLRSALPGLPMTRMDETSAVLTIHSNLIWWLYWANAIISLTLGYLPWRAEVESSILVKNGLSLQGSEFSFFVWWKHNVKIKSWLMRAVIKKSLHQDVIVQLMNRCVFFALNRIAWLVWHNISPIWRLG